MRCAIFLLATLVCFALVGFGILLSDNDSAQMGAYVTLGFIVVAVFVVVILGVVLILNGFTMVKKEGRRLGNLLGLFLGLVMVGYVAAAVIAVLGNYLDVFLWVVVVGFPLAYLGFGFTAYLLYSWIYQGFTRRWAKPPDVVVILGAVLINNQITPLLASRLDRGMAIMTKAVPEHKPVLVVSGGMGSDEARSEASAMTEYLVSKGVSADQIVVEDTSRTTKENLFNTKALLEARGIAGRFVAVTNNFHAFRAALLLCRAKIPGYAIGSPTAHYYWPAATIREYAAILLDSLGFTIVCLCISCVPLVGYAVAHLIP